ncbi:OmpA family protein [Xanthomarina sp. F1114]|uniref:OmpA family protein n=1 Tax=Xanthomarina sp. F1114 TaxID=2996019 RepID=UPI00225E42B5|nr:OmpA family protein [Xanthomarina sp. F1114]MCX7547651.1 OmpA family protein [Xanthomarina sp. F1114]
MRILKIFFLLLIFCQVAHSQNSKLKKANKLFADRAYVQAAELYEELDIPDSLLVNLADAYYYNSIMDKAVINYAKAISSQSFDSNSIYFKYAQALYGTKNVRKADSIMSIYNGKNLNTPTFISKVNLANPFIYDLKLITEGSQSGDFGITYFGEKVAFSSLRNTDNRTYEWNDKPYLDLYSATFEDRGALIDIIPFNKDVNSKSHESNAIITQDGQTMYFSRTSLKRVKIGEQKIATVRLFKAELVENEWSNIEELPFSSELYSIQHPSLNSDNTKLYFSSDMPGGKGSFDIYYVDINDDGYGNPINLGDAINTPHLEQFPFISDTGSLYFASNGLQGLGGLDIFMCEYNNEKWSSPLNLGSTINSSLDDFAFIVNSNDNTGFLSSNKEGMDKLYYFKRAENSRKLIVEGIVKDKNSKELLPGTMVTLFDENNKVIDSVQVKEDGKYSFKVRPFSTFKIEGYRPFYIPNTVGFETEDSGKIELNIELELESYDDAEEIVVEKEDGYVYIELENIYFDLDKWDIKPNAGKTLDVLVNLMKKYPRMEVLLGAHTDNRSTFEYNMVLSENRAKSAMNYILSKGIESNRLTSKGYGESQLLVDCGENCTEEEHSINRRCEFIIVK